MTQESNSESAQLKSADVLRVLAATLSVAALCATALLFLFAVLLGQALGGLITTILGRGKPMMSNGTALGFVLAIGVGQLVLSWLAASWLTPLARRRSARRLALGVSLGLCLISALGFDVVNRARTARQREVNHLLEQRVEAEYKKRREESEARAAEMAKNLELEKQRLEAQAKEEAAILAQRQQLLEEAKRRATTAAARARKK